MLAEVIVQLARSTEDRFRFDQCFTVQTSDRYPERRIVIVIERRNSGLDYVSMESIAKYSLLGGIRQLVFPSAIVALLYAGVGP